MKSLLAAAVLCAGATMFPARTLHAQVKAKCYTCSITEGAFGCRSNAFLGRSGGCTLTFDANGNLRCQASGAQCKNLGMLAPDGALIVAGLDRTTTVAWSSGTKTARRGCDDAVLVTVVTPLEAESRRKSTATLSL